MVPRPVRCSFHMSDSFLSQGFHSCCFLWLKPSFHRSNSFLPHFIPMSPRQRGSWMTVSKIAAFPPAQSLSNPLLCFLLLHDTYYHGNLYLHGFVYTRPSQNVYEGKNFVLFAVISPDPRTLASIL